MPNHIHGIVLIHEQAAGIPPMVQWFKIMTTNAYIRGVKADRWQPFDKRLWQRSYHDRIIRDEKALATIWDYIENNPQRWSRLRVSPRTTPSS
jgi:REP element-mobilizing transposase RayT